MYKRSQLSPTVSIVASEHDSLKNEDKESAVYGEDSAGFNANNAKLNIQLTSNASTTADVSSLAEYNDNMDELPSSGHTHGTLQKKGKLVTFFRNGDQNFKGLTVPISQKWFITLETLIVYLNGKISTPTGIRHLFRLPEGTEVRNVTDFEPNQSYVVSSVRRLVHDVQYGQSLEKPWSNKPPSASKIRKNDKYLYSNSQDEPITSKMSSLSLRNEQPVKHVDSDKHRLPPVRGPTRKKPMPTISTVGHNIKIISNTQRQSSTIIFVEKVGDVVKMPKFEDLLYDLSQALDIAQPPIQTLYTGSKPYKRVCSYSQMFNEFRKETVYIACGTEFYPIETNKSNRNESSYTPKEKQKKKFHTTFTQTEELQNNIKDDYQKFATSTNHKPISKPLPRGDRSTNDPAYITIRGNEKALYPSKFKTPRPTEKRDPKLSISINWIYGFNSRIGGCVKLDILNPDEIIYCVDKTVIIYNNARYQQRYFVKHTAAISCFTVHPDKNIIGSAQSSDREALIFIWEPLECSVLHIISSNSLGPYIYSIDFSKESSTNYLLVLEGNTKDFQRQTRQQLQQQEQQLQQLLSIYSWSSGKKIASSKCNRTYSVAQAHFHPEDSSSIISLGVQHVNIWRVFWQQSSGKTAANAESTARILRDKKSGIFDFCVPDRVCSLTFDMIGNALTGDTNGTIHLWARDEEDAFVNRTPPFLYHAHLGKVTCLVVIGDGTVLSASDHTLRSWDSFNDFKFMKERNIPGYHGNIIAVVPCHPERIDGKLWIGTDTDCVLEGSMQDTFHVIVPGMCDNGNGNGSGNTNVLGNRNASSSSRSSSSGNDINRGGRNISSSNNTHFRICIATSPLDHCFVSTGSHMLLTKWSMLQQKILWNTSLDTGATIVQYHPEGQVILVGTEIGKFIVVKSKTGSHIMSLQVENGLNAISCFSMSPDSKQLLVGCSSADIKFFHVLDNGSFYRHTTTIELKGSCNTQKIDWSIDERFIRTEDSTFTNKIWQLKPNIKEVGAAESTNIEFESDECLATYTKLGLWNCPMIEELSAVKRTKNHERLLYGTSTGTVGIVSYPPIADVINDTHMIPVSTSSIQCIDVAFDDSFILIATADSSCPCIIQWTHII